MIHDDEVELSDDALLSAWRAGDAASGERLWRRHARSVQRFFRNKVPWAVAMDLAQRTLESALRSHRTARSFRGYILGIAKHELFDYLRAEQRKKRRDAELETFVVDQSVADPEAWVSAKREKRVLLHALRRMPLPIQLVLELRYWERMSDGDIAEVLEIPLGTVKSRIAAGRTALRDEMARLTASAQPLRSTVDSLDQWASRTQATLGPLLAGSHADRGDPSSRS